MTSEDFHDDFQPLSGSETRREFNGGNRHVQTVMTLLWFLFAITSKHLTRLAIVVVREII